MHLLLVVHGVGVYTDPANTDPVPAAVASAAAAASTHPAAAAAVSHPAAMLLPWIRTLFCLVSCVCIC
jgi:hypothetical protein